MPGPIYATAAQARADTERLMDARRVGAAPWALLATIEQVVLNQHSNSDVLLIHADALREPATALEGSPCGLAMKRLADALTELAPTRANPIREPEA